MGSTGVNMRPQGQPDAPGYSPQRDLAYVYPELMRTAFQLLDDCNWTPDFRLRMEVSGVTEDELAVGVERFVRALDLFIRDVSIQSPKDAYERTGFLELSRVVQQVLFETFGIVLTGGWFTAVRDVTLRGHMSDAASQTAAMRAAGQLLFTSLYSASSDNDEAQRLNFGRYDVHRGTVEAIALRDAALKALQQSQEDLRAARAESLLAEQRAVTVQRLYKAACSVEQAVQAVTQSWVSAPFVSRVMLGAKIFMKIIFKREVLHGITGTTADTTTANSEHVSDPN